MIIVATFIDVYLPAYALRSQTLLENKTKTNQPNNATVLAFLFFISVNAFGAFVFYHQFVKDINQQLSISTYKAVALIDQVFTFAEKASLDALAESDDKCDAILLVLREKVALVPFVRTITLANKGVFFCSSLLGDVSHDRIQIIDEDYHSGKLFLMTGNSLKKNHPLVIFRENKPPFTALVSVDSAYIEMILNISRGNAGMNFRVGNKYIDESGVYHYNKNEMQSFFSSESYSSKYPFSIYSYTTLSNTMDKFKDEYGLLAITSSILSIVVAFLIRRLLMTPVTFSDQIKFGLQNNEFVPYFQPLIESKGNRLMGVEVLMRWNHSTDGVIPPDLFIPQAEASGLIVDMTRKLIIDTALILQSYQHILPSEFHVGFNVTSQHLEKESLIEDCLHFFKICSSERFILVLELTETSILNYTDDIMKKLKKLSSIGALLALDDFGTGHSSLTTLQKFNFNCIKIDKSFIARIGDEPCSRHIVDSVISLAKKLELFIVAEGVETLAQENYLREKRVDCLQGYLYSPPLDKDQFGLYLIKSQFNNVE